MTTALKVSYDGTDEASFMLEMFECLRVVLGCPMHVVPGDRPIAYYDCPDDKAQAVHNFLNGGSMFTCDLAGEAR